MPNPMFILDPNNPMVTQLMQRNPNGVFATLIRNGQARNGVSSTPTNISGSNNAGGTVSPSSGSTGGLAPSGGVPMSFNRQGAEGIVTNGQPRFGFGAANGQGTQAAFMGGSPTSFAAGGMVTPQGGAIRPGAGMMPSDEPALGAAAPAPMQPADIEQAAQQFVQQHPEEAQKVQAVMAVAIQTGELTSQELNMAIQLAKTALGNPSAYPQIREFAIKNGLGTEQDIPPQMDQGLLYTLLVAGKAMQSQGPTSGGNAMNGQGPAPTMENNVLPSYKEGGMTGDTPHLAKVHPREYVIPEDALIYHGKKHFDKLVEQARTPPDANAN